MEGNKLQRQKIWSFIYPIYNHNWRNISTIYIYITRLASNEIFSPSNKIHREVGRDKDLSALRYYFTKQHKLLVLVMQRVFSMTWDCILFCNFYKQAFWLTGLMNVFWLWWKADRTGQICGSEWDEQLGGLNTTSCGWQGEKWGWEGGCPHLPGRQDGRGLATRNWRQFHHSWVHIASSCFFNYLGNAVCKRELCNKHIQLLFVLTCMPHTPALLCTAIFLFLDTSFAIQWKVGKSYEYVV